MMGMIAIYNNKWIWREMGYYVVKTNYKIMLHLKRHKNLFEENPMTFNVCCEHVVKTYSKTALILMPPNNFNAAAR